MKSRLLVALLALAPSAAAQNNAAYLVDSNLDVLFYVDISNGAAYPIGSTLGGGAMTTPAGLTWRPDTQTMWTIDLSGGEVGTIDLATGAFTTVFNTGLSGWQGMDYDPVTAKFYLLNQSLNVYSLDPTTGQTTLLGASGAPLCTAMDTDPSGTLYAIGFSTPATLYTVDKTTGVFTPGTSTTPVGMQGLSFAPNGRLYGANTTTDSLYVIDPVTGTSTLIGAHGANVQFAKGFEITTLPALTIAQVLISGTGCGGLTQTSGRPVLGTTFDLTANGIPAGSTLGFEIIGLPSGGIDLTGAGLTGCTLYVLPILASLPFATGATSAATTVTLPTDPSLLGGAIPVQAVVVAPGVNPAGIVLSNLATLVVGSV